MNRRTVTVLAALAAALLVTAGCNKGDQIAPEGATIDLAASQNPIPVPVDELGMSEIIATVSSQAGVPLPDQDVRFTSTAGELMDQPVDGDPVANIPIRTDSFGNAHVFLFTGKTTTVTGRSGLATGSLTLDTVPADLNAITLNTEQPSTDCLSSTVFTSCPQYLCLVAQAVTDEGTGIPGIVLKFVLYTTSSGDDNPLSANFSINNYTTDSGGKVHTRFSLVGDTCGTQCPSGEEPCEGEIVASLPAGGFVSTAITISTNF